MVAALASIVSMAGCGDNRAQMEASLDERNEKIHQKELVDEARRRAE